MSDARCDFGFETVKAPIAPIVVHSGASPGEGSGDSGPSSLTTMLEMDGKESASYCREKCEAWARKNRVSCGGYSCLSQV